ncbi:unnamed protein product [Parajaminaea phylloscopi]
MPAKTGNVSEDEARDSGEEEEGEVDEDADEVDPDVQAFLASQQALRARDTESDRMREERIRSGGVKGTKSKYQKEREEAERKKAEQEQEAARAYEEFAAAMAGDEKRSHTRTASRKPQTMGFVTAGGAKPYQPTREKERDATHIQQGAAEHAVPAAKTAIERTGPIFGDEDEDDQPVKGATDTKLKREGSHKKSGVMTSFLGELQQQQAEREQRYKSEIEGGKSVSSILASEGQRMGSKDTGDPLTTNVCVLNLPANISEKALGEFFCQWGDIGTVKIMWPRGEDIVGGAGAGITLLRNTRSAGLTGFVCFMRRDDAEIALEEGEGISWGGSLLHTSWGKAMPKPARAHYLAPAEARATRARRETRTDSASMSMSSSRKRSRPEEQGADSLPGRHRRRGSRSRSRSRSPSPRSRLHVEMAESEAAQVIRTVADRIREYGPAFERLVREKEQENPNFHWLRQEGSREGQYFRMLLDEKYIPELPEEPFKDDAGSLSLYDGDSEEEAEKQRLKKQRKTSTLGSRARRRFEAMLRSITPRRERIARAMEFAMDHANAAETVTDILTQSLLIPSTPVPRKLARLHVVSDVLHNSAAPVPNAWKYRSSMESRMTVVFRHLGDVARSFPGLMKQEGFRTQVRAVLDVWDSWLVFAPNTLEALRSALGTGNSRDSGSKDAGEDVPSAGDVCESGAAAAASRVGGEGEHKDPNGGSVASDVDGQSFGEDSDIDGDVM